MFLSYASKKEEIYNIVIQDLKNYGIKYRQKKAKQNVQEFKGRKLFKKPLSTLPTETVTKPSGQQLIVPKLVHELCSFILNKVQTEGLFRKGGSKSRQNEIKLYIDAGCHLNDDHNEIDVASVLKTFFRELPEPLLPHAYHEIFLRCMLLKQNQLDAILLCCLLLPPEHLNTLTYFMQFLNEVTEYSVCNKMDSYNLSIVIGPTLLPVDEKVAFSATERLAKTCELFKILIDNAYRIGILPDDVINRLGIKSSNDVPEGNLLNVNNKKKKKRRSGSLTRMLNGLKKIVSSKSAEEEEPPRASTTPDLLLTPCLTNSAKKRKMETGFSNKKRKDLINNLPHSSVLNAPYAPCSRTPVSVDPNPKQDDTPSTGKIQNEKWYAKTKRSSHVNLKKQWSAVSNQVTSLKRNKRSTSTSITKQDPLNDPDYVRIPKAEYEEIKSRVRAIEKRISLELDKDPNTDDAIEKVQDEYEKTLIQTEPLSPTTDHLARRLSKELKIRKNSESKVIRSPSARKIGSLRRRSKETERAIVRRQSWHVANLEVVPKVNLKRGRPNTVQSGLKTPPTKESPMAIKSSSFDEASLSYPITRSRSKQEKWANAEGFFNKLKLTPSNSTVSLESCRASIVKLRHQNAGMVLAKAKLFDELLDSDSSNCTGNVPKTKAVRCLVNNHVDRKVDRIRTLKADERKVVRKSLSPRKKSIPRHKLQLVKVKAFDGLNEKENVPDLLKSPVCCNSPQNVPYIKKTLSVRSPKRLHRTPAVKLDYKRTPIKVTTKPVMSDF